MEGSKPESKFIAEFEGDRAYRIAVLLASGLWDSFTIQELYFWCEGGKLVDNAAGRSLYSLIVDC